MDHLLFRLARLCWAIPVLFALSGRAETPVPDQKDVAGYFIVPHRLEYPTPGSPMDLSALNGDIESEGFIKIQDGHFFNNSGRINFFGVNLTFDAMFPGREEAEVLASHLARLGINCVRIHHIDKRDIWGERVNHNYDHFDPIQLDRLDYFVSRLKAHGIYINLNLHVTWSYRKTDAFDYTQLGLQVKGLDLLVPELIAMQKEYARALLRHVNPYTGKTYADDPVVALVEINNENGVVRQFLMKERLDKLPPELQPIFDASWHQFLETKYGTFDDLREAWLSHGDDTPVLAEACTPFVKNQGWYTRPDRDARVELGGDTAVVRLDPALDGEPFHLMRSGLDLVKGERYTLVLEVESSGRGGEFDVAINRARAPWKRLSPVFRVEVSSDGTQEIILPFVAGDDVERYGRIDFSDFSGAEEFRLLRVDLYQGEYLCDPIDGSNAIAKLPIPSVSRLDTYPKAVRDDLVAWLYQIAADYWEEMVAFVREDCGVKVPVTGTQVDHTFTAIADLYDYTDRHIYWKHPKFPNTPWDLNDYYVENASMVTADNDTFTQTAPTRIADKPFIMSEYNHPFQNAYNAEAITIGAAISRLQDYDGFFLFNYLNSLDLKQMNFFSSFHMAAQKAQFPFAAYVFREGVVDPLTAKVSFPLGLEDELAVAQQRKLSSNPYLNGVYYRKDSPNIPFLLLDQAQVSVVPLPDSAPVVEDMNAYAIKDADTPLTWQRGTDGEEAYFRLNAPGAKAYIGWADPSRSYPLGNITLDSVRAPGRYFQFTCINRDGLIGEPGTHILDLFGGSHYKGKEYIDYESKRVVEPGVDSEGKQLLVHSWRDVPELIEIVEGTITLRISPEASVDGIQAFALNASGEKAQRIPVEVMNSSTVRFRALTDYGTGIYTIEVPSMHTTSQD